MKSKEELNEIREKNYRKWFERFFKAKQIEKNIEISNEKGFTTYTINPENYIDDRDKMMIRSEMFVSLLKEKLPGFNVFVVEGTVPYTILGIELQRSYYKVKISW